MIAYLASMDPRRLHAHTRWATKATHPRREEPCSDSARRRRARLSSLSFSLSRRRRSWSDLGRLPDLTRGRRAAIGGLPPAPVAIAAGRTSVWTGTELIVSGVTGAAPDGNLLNSTEITLAYNPRPMPGAGWHPHRRPATIAAGVPSGRVRNARVGLRLRGVRPAEQSLAATVRSTGAPGDRRVDRPRDHRLGRRLLRRRRRRRRCLHPRHRHVAQAGSITPRCRAAPHRGLDRTRARPLRQRSRRCERQALAGTVCPGRRLQPGDRYVARIAPRRRPATEQVSSGPIARFSSSAA